MKVINKEKIKGVSGGLNNCYCYDLAGQSGSHWVVSGVNFYTDCKPECCDKRSAGSWSYGQNWLPASWQFHGDC